ncbi:helix-turn-helix domain-containing protein [Nonomuraea sp. NPDC005650]|uniref:TetR/AcrR family transcriptional regulator n=1 Tax=Nonomuraea sp. NPDC005650 TaxID=3157045 RepID=UPI0033B35971
MTASEPASAGASAERPTTTQRPLRAHAQRNRDKLIAVARSAFATADETVSLESIAREAGVGIGTLYRHFPTREALVEAVYAAEIDAIATSAPALLERFPPEMALRAWMDRYATFFAMKRGMADALRAGQASGRIPTSTTRERITASVMTILAEGADTGSLRADVDPDDVTTMLVGIFLATAALDTPEQTGRLLDLLIDALRPQESR